MPGYLRMAKSAGLSDDELDAIAAYIAENPDCGAVMPGTGGARKVRFAPSGRGKRGGFRVIHYYAADDVPVFLLAVLSKGQRSDLSKTEKNDLRNILGTLADDYRKTMNTRVRRIGRKK
jgi:hypothetical protein